jgi:predicted O-methyltransferase YrrM
MVQNEVGPKWNETDIIAMSALGALSGPFLPWNSWAMRPGALLTVLDEIAVRRRRSIVEIGSGVSTILIGRLLRDEKIPGARLVSVESDVAWVEDVRRRIEAEGLEAFVDVVHATPATLPEANDPELPAEWYDVDVVRAAIEEIDVLVVDGPAAGQSRTLVRHPAVPALRDLLVDDAVVYLDDVDRPSETRIVERWERELGIEFAVWDRLALAVGRLGDGYTIVA